ncbi:hypothetical protein ACHWQZ_G000176 [Mnemiopsis leidyi]
MSGRILRGTESTLSLRNNVVVVPGEGSQLSRSDRKRIRGARRVSPVGPNAMAGVSAIAAASLPRPDNVLSAGHLAGTPVEIREENQTDTLIRINVSGTRYITYKDTLKQFPNTLLGSERISQFYNEDIKEYFFDRNRIAFDAILYYYQSGGYLYLPPGLEMPVFQEELQYFEIPSNPSGETNEADKESLLDNYPYNKYFLKLHYILDHPDSGILAKLWMVLDVIFIVISMTLFIAETDPKVEKTIEDSKEVAQIFFYLDAVCIIFFTIDLLLRLIVAPSKQHFFKRTLNWLDFAAILPFYIEIPLKDSSGITALRVLRLFRVLRILKVIRHSKQLILILQVLKQSCRELLLLVVMWAMGVVTFGSIMYYIEEDQPDSEFNSILKACWWAVVTMSTVGYGDLYPTSVPGKLVGSVVVFLSMVFMALPMTIIVSKFSRAYEEMKEPNQMVSGGLEEQQGSQLSINGKPDVETGNDKLHPPGHNSTSL